MKKIVSIIIGLGIILTFSGCGTAVKTLDNTQSETETTVDTNTEVTMESEPDEIQIGDTKFTSEDLVGNWVDSTGESDIVLTFYEDGTVYISSTKRKYEYEFNKKLNYLQIHFTELVSLEYQNIDGVIHLIDTLYDADYVKDTSMEIELEKETQTEGIELTTGELVGNWVDSTGESDIVLTFYEDGTVYISSTKRKYEYEFNKKLNYLQIHFTELVSLEYQNIDGVIHLIDTLNDADYVKEAEQE